MKISDACTSLQPILDTNIPSDDSSVEIDDAEMGEFLIEALSDFHPLDEEHDAFLQSLCEV